MADSATFQLAGESTDELINSIVDYSIVRLDTTGKVMSGNVATTAIYGYSRGELSG